MRCGARCGPGSGRAWGTAAAQAGMHGEERTKNISYMFVTLEVSQLEMSALKLLSLNIWCMFVTLDVSQLEMSSALKFLVP